jgi:hypothetical protein
LFVVGTGKLWRGLVVALASCALLLAMPVSAQAALSRTSQRNALKALAIRTTNNSLHYVHSTWFNANYAYSTVEASVEATSEGSEDTTESIDLLVPKGGLAVGEYAVRPQASAAYATAIALRTGIWDERLIGVSKVEARRRTVAWVNAIAYSYPRDNWKRRWQSALWVYYMGFAAHQVWDDVPQQTQGLVTAAIQSEADRLLGISPPSYRNASGHIVYPGDSKSEENAWNGALLILAARYYPAHPNAAKWEARGRWYAMSAYSIPGQVGHDPRLRGSNLNPDGTVTNHRIIHPDYMFTEAEFIAKHSLMALETKTATSKEAANNFWRVWKGLTRVRFRGKAYYAPGGTILRKDRKGNPTADMYYPQGTDWSRVRRFNAAQTAVEAFAGKLDSNSYGWAKVHLNYVLRQQARHSDGRVFSARETSFVGDEQFAAVTGAEMVFRLQTIR